MTFRWAAGLGPWVLGMPGAMTYPEVYFIAQ